MKNVTDDNKAFWKTKPFQENRCVYVVNNIGDPISGPP